MQVLKAVNSLSKKCVAEHKVVVENPTVVYKDMNEVNEERGIIEKKSKQRQQRKQQK